MAVANRPPDMLEDLELSPGEQAEEERRQAMSYEERVQEDAMREAGLEMTPQEIADEAAAKEAALGGGEEAVEFARSQALKAAEAAREAEAAQAELDESPSQVEEPLGEIPEPALPPDALAVSGRSSAPRRWNGKAPTQTVLIFKSLHIEVPDGDFRKGERLTFEGEAAVVSEGVEDKLDPETKTPSDAIQSHKAVVLDFQLTD